MLKKILIPNELFIAHHNITPESAFPSSCTAIKRLHAHSLISADRVVHLQDLMLLLSWKVVSDSLQLHGPGFPVHHNPLLSPPPALSVPQHQGLFNELSLHIRWLKYWSFSFSINLSSEYSELISFRVDLFDLLADQGTLKSLLQHHNMKSINSLVLNLLYGPTLTSIHDYWKNHSFDYMDLCQQNDVSAF